jgi:predicted ATPase
MIKSLVVKGLWGRYDYDLQFNEDVNIFTGSNGTGKTTLLKLLWYVYSGNYTQLVSEIQFKEFLVIDNSGTKISLKLTPSRLGGKKNFYEFKLIYGVDKINESGDGDIDESGYIIDGRFMPEKSKGYSIGEDGLSSIYPSYFFPTFRRLEGGFSLQENNGLGSALHDITMRLSKDHHRFITSSNSEDIRGMVNEISSEIRLKLEAINTAFMDFIANNMNGGMKNGFTEELKKKIERKEREESNAKEPIDTLSKYVDQFFLEKSIKISDNLKLGHHRNEILVEHLSAGEKNFLSFLVYATSLREGVIFIDEPELNLHIDWQRALVSTLQEIAPNVQLFMASHSPGIYAGYADKAPWFNDLVRHTTSSEPALVE